jgi:hypothetical protein
MASANAQVGGARTVLTSHAETPGGDTAATPQAVVSQAEPPGDDVTVTPSAQAEPPGDDVATTPRARITVQAGTGGQAAATSSAVRGIDMAAGSAGVILLVAGGIGLRRRRMLRS